MPTEYNKSVNGMENEIIVQIIHWYSLESNLRWILEYF